MEFCVHLQSRLLLPSALAARNTALESKTTTHRRHSNVIPVSMRRVADRQHLAKAVFVYGAGRGAGQSGMPEPPSQRVERWLRRLPLHHHVAAAEARFGSHRTDWPRTMRATVLRAWIGCGAGLLDRTKANGKASNRSLHDAPNACSPRPDRPRSRR
jgi:hypothetical protein